jgi:hypothetical protein
VVGLDYRPEGADEEKRAEPGAVVDDLPEKSIRWLLRDGLIEEASGRDSTARTREVKKAAKETGQPFEIPERLAAIRSPEEATG